MSFRLPLTGTDTREACGDMRTLAETLNPDNAHKLLSVWQARKLAEHQFAVNPATRRVFFVIIRADSDQRWLVSFGPRGGWRKEWNFGTGRD